MPITLTFVAFLADKKKQVKEPSTPKMVLRSAKKRIKFDESKNKSEIYYIDKKYLKTFYFDSSQIKENLKNRREIIAQRKIEKW